MSQSRVEAEAMRMGYFANGDSVSSTQTVILNFSSNRSNNLYPSGGLELTC